MGRKFGWSLVAIAGALAIACGGGGSASKPDPLAGQLTASGGGAVIPTLKPLMDKFTALHPRVAWMVEDVGSDASVKLVSENSVDLGFTSRNLSSEEKTRVEALPLGAVGTAVVVNSANLVTALSKDQIRRIFTGEVSDWSQVDGAPGKIKVLIREPNAATRSSFESYIFGGKAVYTKDAIEVYEIAAMTSAVHSFRDSIGMITLSQETVSDPAMRLLTVDGVRATQETLTSGAYPMRRPLFLIYNPDETKMKPAIRAFVDFVRRETAAATHQLAGASSP